MNLKMLFEIFIFIIVQIGILILMYSFVGFWHKSHVPSDSFSRGKQQKEVYISLLINDKTIYIKANLPAHFTMDVEKKLLESVKKYVEDRSFSFELNEKKEIFKDIGFGSLSDDTPNTQVNQQLMSIIAQVILIVSKFRPRNFNINTLYRKLTKMGQSFLDIYNGDITELN